jgi:hypothetical protein
VCNVRARWRLTALFAQLESAPAGRLSDNGKRGARFIVNRLYTDQTNATI